MKKSEALNILGLHDGFTEDELKKAHRKKVIENHPDQFQDPAQKAKAEEQTKLINEANDVLKSGKWDPEYGPRMHTSAYGSPYASAGPYRSPYAGQQGPEWVEVDPEMFRQWAQQAAQQQQQQGYDPFAPFTTAYTPPTAEQKEARAKQDMRIGFIMLAIKLAVCGGLLLHGNYIEAPIVWAIITYTLLLASRFGGCAWIVIIPIFFVFQTWGGILEAAAMQGGLFSTLIIGALFISALYYDFRDIRDAVKRYRAARAESE